MVECQNCIAFFNCVGSFEKVNMKIYSISKQNHFIWKKQQNTKVGALPIKRMYRWWLLVAT